MSLHPSSSARGIHPPVVWAWVSRMWALAATVSSAPNVQRRLRAIDGGRPNFATRADGPMMAQRERSHSELLVGQNRVWLI